MNSDKEQAMALENAISDMKRQLRAESKSYLIRTWIALYAQTINQAKEIENLKNKLSSQTQATEASASESESK